MEGIDQQVKAIQVKQHQHLSILIPGYQPSIGIKTPTCREGQKLEAKEKGDFYKSL